MKAILLGDIHFSAKLLEEVEDAWRWLLSFATKNKVDLILQAGDIFDHHNIHARTHDVGTVYDALAKHLVQSGIPFFTIAGNHDIGRPTDVDALATLQWLPNVLVSRTPELINLKSNFPSLPEDALVCTLPWIYPQHLAFKLEAKEDKDINEKIANFQKLLVPKIAQKVKEEKEKGKFVFLIGHLEVTGAKLNSFYGQAEGLYEFSPSLLATIAADVFGLGHIHIRQSIDLLPNPNDGYLGTLLQTKYGEAGNETGFRYIVTENGKIVEDTFVNNEISPKYYVLEKYEDLEKTDYKKGRDRALVVADQRPQGLPEGVEFRKKKVNKEAREQETGLDCDTPIEELLKIWKETSKCETDLGVLVTKTKELSSAVVDTVNSIGSLERIDRIKLKNITCHSETELDLTPINGLCGVEGNNGSGKTTVLEGILLGLYGFSPSRRYLPSVLSYGCEDSSLVEVDFQSRGKKYSVSRDMKNGKKFSHKASMTEEGNKVPLAGPKVEEVSKTSCELVGDPDLVLAGIFSSQGEAGNILDLEPSERKKCFAKLLGTDKFLVFSDLAKKRASQVRTAIETTNAKIEQISSELTEKPIDEGQLSALRDQIDECHKKEKELDDTLQEANKRLEQFRVSNLSRQEMIQKKLDLDSKMSEIKTKAAGLKNQKDELEKLPSEQYFKEQLKTITDAEKGLEELRKVAQEIHDKKTEIAGQIADLKQKLSQIKEERSQKYAGYVKSITDKQNEIIGNFNSQKLVMDTSILKSEGKIENLNAELENAKKKAKLIENIPNKPICKECPLAKDGLDAKEQIKETTEKIRIEQNALKYLKHDRENLLEPAVPACCSLEEFDPSSNEACASTEKQIKKMEEAVEKIAPTEEMKTAARTFKELVSMKDSIEAKLEKARNVNVEVATITGSIDSLKSQYQQLSKEMNFIVVPDEKDEGPTKMIITNIGEMKGQLAQRVSNLSKEQGKIEEQIESFKRKKEQKEKLEKSIENQKTEVEIFSTLTNAFGANGIPQLIVDSTIPHFEEIMSKLMSDFDGRWEIQVRSQRVSKSGNVQEAIDIMADDGDGPREISTYSGGEKKLLKSIIRIAFSTLQAERSGRGLKVLVLDEATDGMDGEIAPNYLGMLKKLTCFNQIFVVSHNDRDISSFPQTISLSRKHGHSSEVTYKGVMR